MLTTTAVAAALDVPSHVLERLLLKHAVKPARRAGRYRLFSEEQVEEIRSLLPESRARQLHGEYR